MTRLRWLKVNWPFDIRTLSRQLGSIQFSQETPIGFIVDKARQNSLEARFVERDQYMQSVRSPFGQEIILERVDFRSVAFRAFPDPLGLELIDAPRGLETFFSKLSEACKFEFYFTGVTVDIMAWCDALEQIIECPLDLESLHLSDVYVLDDVKASIVLRGEHNLKIAAEKVSGGARYRNDKLKARCRKGAQFTIILSHQGYASFEGRTPPEFSNNLRIALQASLTRQSI